MEQEKITKEEHERFQYRVELYKKGSKELSEKTGIIILTQALLTPDGRVTSQLVFGDKDTFEKQMVEQNMNRKQRRANKIVSSE